MSAAQSARTIRAVRIDGPHAFDVVIEGDALAGLQSAVGGNVECVGEFDSLSGATVFCNEEGLFAHEDEWATFYILAEFGRGNPVVGPLVVVGTDENGETVDSPLSAKDIAGRLARFGAKIELAAHGIVLHRDLPFEFPVLAAA